MEQPAIGPVVEAVIDALGGSGSEAVAAYLDEETLLHMPGGSGFAGDFQGRDAICGLIDRMVEVSGGTLRFETACTTAREGGSVRLSGDVRGLRLARSLRMNASVEMTVTGGTIREAWLACSDQPGWDAFWA